MSLIIFKEMCCKGTSFLPTHAHSVDCLATGAQGIGSAFNRLLSFFSLIKNIRLFFLITKDLQS